MRELVALLVVLEADSTLPTKWTKKEIEREYVYVCYTIGPTEASHTQHNLVHPMSNCSLDHM